MNANYLHPLTRGETGLNVLKPHLKTTIATLLRAGIAKAENVDNSYVSRMVNLTTLAPDIQAAILDETLPGTVSLFDLAVDTPLSREAQRSLLAQR